ncbi:MAG: hypothetical protein AMXMBFR23_26230 [Chloroflexota bacterium]
MRLTRMANARSATTARAAFSTVRADGVGMRRLMRRILASERRGGRRATDIRTPVAILVVPQPGTPASRLRAHPEFSP